MGVVPTKFKLKKILYKNIPN